MATMPRGSAIFDLGMPIVSAEVMHRGATMPKTTTGLWTIWVSSMARMQYAKRTFVILPLAILEMPLASSVQKRVRLKPAATTLMAAIMITVLLEKYPSASAGVRQPVKDRATKETSAVVPRLQILVMYPMHVRTNRIRQITSCESIMFPPVERNRLLSAVSSPCFFGRSCSHLSSFW